MIPFVIVGAGLGVCGCGYFSSASLVFTFPGFFVGGLFFYGSGKRILSSYAYSVDGIFSILGLMILTWLLVKSFADILWLSHGAIFPLSLW
ncbi:hypothetical protein N9940_01700 [bacterium]|nr:hypothetical protein [Akkermansiaceae bacterium]MDB4257804.1 hypothetical protein [bacterium]MDA7649299.1 hypothetical protein [Akkermansiaceae bacterium]MDA7862656.1 hypothetical protein [Akkermansiaceae bacterium]MDB4143505.1 hypothetical protein [Akkermansiaceae bacterium]